ncbi:dynein light chain roadblock-type [Paragonimus westermani]|uniref:Dynein light chain roadblock-type n=1 Tax=Paragonimus westermani TaxID=34504 RepID=A0A5J4NCE4_9TREM|nr:dynein light chain roadblock-type [Paragonimus westermani]
MANYNSVTENNTNVMQQIERIQNHKNVQGLILVNAEGNPIRSNMDNSTSLQYTRHMDELRSITEHVVRDLDPSDELVVLRIRTKFNEIMVLPESGLLNSWSRPTTSYVTVRFDRAEANLNWTSASGALALNSPVTIIRWLAIDGCHPLVGLRE